MATVTFGRARCVGAWRGVAVLAALLACSTFLVAVTSGRASALAVAPTSVIFPPSSLAGAGTTATVATATGEGAGAATVTVGTAGAEGVAVGAGAVLLPVEVAATGFAIGWYGVKGAKWLAHKIDGAGNPDVAGSTTFYVSQTAVQHDGQTGFASWTWGVTERGDFPGTLEFKTYFSDPAGSYTFQFDGSPRDGNVYGAGSGCFDPCPTDSAVPTHVDIIDQTYGLGVIQTLQLQAVPTTRTIERVTGCQDGSGIITHYTTVGGSFDAVTDYANPPDLPSFTCPANSHVVDDKTQLADPQGNITPGTDWALPSTATDPANPRSQCMALAGADPCELTQTGTGDCLWGSITVDGSDCGSFTGLPTPPPGPTATPTPTATATGDPTPTPTSTTGSGTSTVQVTGPAPAGDPSGGGCFPSGWGAFNPVEWVLTPVKCALKWAFVPSTSTVTQIEHAGDGFMGRPPMSFVAAFPGWIAPLAAGGSSSCPDWTVHVGTHPYSVVCDQPFMQRIHDARPLLLALMLLTAVSGFLWSLWYAVLPFVRATPTVRMAEGSGDAL